MKGQRWRTATRSPVDSNPRLLDWGCSLGRSLHCCPGPGELRHRPGPHQAKQRGGKKGEIGGFVLNDKGWAMLHRQPQGWKQFLLCQKLPGNSRAPGLLRFVTLRDTTRYHFHQCSRTCLNGILERGPAVQEDFFQGLRLLRQLPVVLLQQLVGVVEIDHFRWSVETFHHVLQQNVHHILQEGQRRCLPVARWQQVWGWRGKVNTAAGLHGSQAAPFVSRRSFCCVQHKEILLWFVKECGPCFKGCTKGCGQVFVSPSKNSGFCSQDISDQFLRQQEMAGERGKKEKRISGKNGKLVNRKIAATRNPRPAISARWSLVPAAHSWLAARCCAPGSAAAAPSRSSTRRGALLKGKVTVSSSRVPPPRNPPPPPQGPQREGRSSSQRATLRLQSAACSFLLRSGTLSFCTSSGCAAVRGSVPCGAAVSEAAAERRYLLSAGTRSWRRLSGSRRASCRRCRWGRTAEAPPPSGSPWRRDPRASRRLRRAALDNDKGTRAQRRGPRPPSPARGWAPEPRSPALTAQLVADASGELLCHLAPGSGCKT